MSSANYMQLVRKHYGYAPRMFEKLEAILSDLAWHALLRLNELKKPENKRILIKGTVGHSAQELLQHYLRVGIRDPRVTDWMDGVDARAKNLKLIGEGTSFETLLYCATQGFLARTATDLEHQAALCVRLGSILQAVASQVSADKGREAQNLYLYVPAS